MEVSFRKLTPKSNVREEKDDCNDKSRGDNKKTAAIPSEIKDVPVLSHP